MHIHFIGIGGSAMGSVAVACAASGYRVTGSDTSVYPPMSDVLSLAGIKVVEGYDANRLRELNPDCTVIGNAISRGNPELECVLDNRMNMTSMAGFVGNTFISRNTSIVCAGTHGKTTTASIAAWILEHAGREPGFLIGGVPGNFEVGCRPVTATKHDTPLGVFVSEGDEYDTAFFDKRSKFVHYRPTIAIVNNIEFDHADIFKDIDAIVWSFQQLFRRVPRSGVILVNADDATAMKALEGAPCPVETVGTGPSADWRIVDIVEKGASTQWTLSNHENPVCTLELPMPGEHNIRNATMAAIASLKVGVSPDIIASALVLFQPPKRRLEEIGMWRGCVVVDDFAHHPTAIAATISALRQRYSGAVLHIVFEPRSNTTTRNIFQKELEECFEGANTVIFGPVNRPERYEAGQRLDTEKLMAEIQERGAWAFSIPSARAEDPEWGRDIVPLLSSHIQDGDVVALLSNGNVGGLRKMLTGESSNSNE